MSGLERIVVALERRSFQAYRDKIEAAIKNKALKLNLGSGKYTFDDGWINLDMSAYDNDLIMRLPEGFRRFASDSVRFIYTSHFLEHLSYPAEASHLLRE